MSEITEDPPPLQLLLGESSDRPLGETHEVVWATGDSGPVVVKRSTGRGRGALRREAEALRQIRCERLVELVEVVDVDEITALVLRHAGDVTLADLPGGDPGLTLAVIQHVCEAVVELHRTGWAHGRLDPSHVVVGPRGTVRLCSLGEARPIGDRPAAVLDDVDALLSLVEEAIGRVDPDRRADRRDLRRLQGRVADLAEHPDATVPAALGQAIASVRRGDRSRPPATRIAAVLAAVLFGLAGASAVGSIPGRAHTDVPGGRSPGSSTTAPPTTVASTAVAPTTVRPPPEAPAGPPTVTLDDGTYRVGVAGDVAVVGDWDCDGRRTVRLLRPSTGELYEFDDPDAASVTHGRVIARMAGAVAIRALPPDRAVPCDHTVVQLGDGSEQVIP